MDKFKSRKFWVLIGTMALLAVSGPLGIPAALLGKAIVLASAYVIGQGIADHGRK